MMGRKTLRILLYAIGISAFVFLFVKYDFVKTFREIIWLEGNFYLLIISILFYFPIPLFRALRWMMLAKEMEIEGMNFLNSFKLTNASFFISLITPAKIGDMARFFFSRADRDKIFSGTAIEYYFNFLVLCLISALFATIVLFKNVLVYVLILLCVLFFCTFLLFNKWGLEKLIILLLSINKNALSRSLRVKDYLKNSLTNIKVISICSIFSLFIYFSYLISAYFIFLFLSYYVSLKEIIVSLSLGLLGGVISFIPMGLGSREASTLGILVSLGYNPEIITSGLIILRFFTIFHIFIGFISYLIAIKAKRKRNVLFEEE